MDNIRDGGFEELEAICGGCCSCGTCHVYIDPESAVLLPEMADDEDSLLDISLSRDPRSRLSCQIPVTAELDQLRLTIAPED